MAILLPIGVINAFREQKHHFLLPKLLPPPQNGGSELFYFTPFIMTSAWLPAFSSWLKTLRISLIVTDFTTSS